MPSTLLAPWTGMLSALAAGLIIGLERGWRDRDVAEGRRVAGLRTFALAGLLGGALGTLHPAAGAWPLAAGVLALGVLAAQGYREGVRSTANLSVTSAVALVLTFVLGALAALGMPVLAVGAAVVVAVLLNLRTTLHGWLKLIEVHELSAALQMLVLSVVVLPLLPDASYGPYQAINPYRLWWAVILVAGLSLMGHVATRWVGGQRGALWTGVLGGLVSSTAATLALARKARSQPGLVDASAAGATLACAVMFVRMGIILMVLAPSFGVRLLASLLCAAAVLAIAGTVVWRRSAPGRTLAPVEDLHVFDLGTALGYGVFLAIVAVLLHAGQEWLGAAAVYALSFLSGLADVDAITISMARMQVASTVSLQVAAIGVTLAVVANMLTKAVMAWMTGGTRFGRLIAGAYLLATVAAAGVLAASVSLA